MSKHYNRELAFFLLGVALAVSSILAEPSLLEAQSATRAKQSIHTADRFDSVRALIRQIMEEKALPSVAVAVAKDGKIIWEEAFGWADRERMVSATPYTMYSLASISKPITATGLMKLVEKAKVDLDRPANEYLGIGKITGLAGDAAGATVRRILSHTSGLPLHYQFFYENAGYSRPSMDETIARYAIVVNPPGEVFQYSNLGYGIIDHIIARVSGQSYADFMRTEVFVPLEMTRTSIYIGPGLEPFAAARYDSKQRPIPFYDFDHPGGSAVYASAHDLVRFGMFHLKNHLPEQQRILADSTIDAMHRISTRADMTSSYGLGWFITDNDYGYRRISHSGGMPGVSTILNLYPSENLAIVVLTNKSNGEVGRIAEEIATSELPKYAAARKERRKVGHPSPPSPAAFPPPDLVGGWTGNLRTYEGSVPFTLLFRSDGDVHVKLGDQLRTLLNEVSYRKGNLVGRFTGTIPTSDQSRHPSQLVLNLRIRDGKLSGQASALNLIKPIEYYALTSFVELMQVKDLPLSTSERSRYAGLYAFTDSGLADLVFEEGGRLKLENTAGLRSLQYQGNHTFVTAEEPDVRVVFRIEGEQVTGLALIVGRQMSEAKRVPGIR